jgi:hypothetical protein
MRLKAKELKGQSQSIPRVNHFLLYRHFREIRYSRHHIEEMKECYALYKASDPDKLGFDVFRSAAQQANIDVLDGFHLAPTSAKCLKKIFDLQGENTRCRTVANADADTLWLSSKQRKQQA